MLSDKNYRKPCPSLGYELFVIAHVSSQLKAQFYHLPCSYQQANNILGDCNPKNIWTHNYKDWHEIILTLSQNQSSYIPRLSKALQTGVYPPSVLAEEVYRHLQCVQEQGGDYILWGENDYPFPLHHIANPPLALSLLGNKDLLSFPKIAIIGSRKANPLAIEQSARIAKQFADFQIVTVSGGAYGCDISAHYGTTKVKKPPYLSIAVLANGLNKILPLGNMKLLSTIRDHGGLLLSEKLWMQGARPYDFPQRNRIISGLCHEILVMQAGIKSGALVTAKQALDQGREVLVLNQDRQDPNCDGSSYLVDEGAWYFHDCDHLFNQYKFSFEKWNRYEL